jgi:flavin-dependent dehydrogenase
MRSETAVDAAIIGAGPSGCVAALRLLALGRRPALIECLSFPRPQIGESISPGVWDILEYLDAVPALDESAVVKGLPARVAWEGREPRFFSALERGPGLMVDRGDFDARLAALAEARGALRFQPARVRRIEGDPGAWRLSVVGPEGESALDARLIIDARGRSGRSMRSRFALGPATLALWAEVGPDRMPRETRIEAIDRAWLWGAPLPDGRYRVMAFVGSNWMPRGNGRDAAFRGLLADARLFETASSAAFVSPLKTRCATPYIDPEFWRLGSICIGERALALDPLSSTGVEKSMRLALQGVIAANTVLDDPRSAELAREFYEARLLESATVHTNWTRGFYAEAWPGPAHEFWRDRSSAPDEPGSDRTEFLDRLRQIKGASARSSVYRARTARQTDDQAAAQASLAPLSTRVALSSQTRFVATPCAVDDRVQLRDAVTHPCLDRPLVFLGGIEVAPLLRLASDAPDLGHILESWGSVLAAPMAASILHWLLGNGILQTIATDGTTCGKMTTPSS